MRTYFSKLGFIILIALLVSVSGCSTPIGVTKLNPRDSFKESITGPLSEGRQSDSTKIILNRFDLSEKFEDDPVAAMTMLHDRALNDQRRDILFALAELSYLHAEKLEKSWKSEMQKQAPGYFLLAAAYSYYAILDPKLKPVPSLFDHRIRNTCDLYNNSIWRGLATGDDGSVELRDIKYDLPFGQIHISIDADGFPWKIEKFERFEAADKFGVHGLSVKNRINGIGTPLIAIKKQDKDSILGGQAIPATAFLRMKTDLDQLKTKKIEASLEIYSSYDDVKIKVNQTEIPLETDTTTHVAYKLDDERIWSFGTDLFLGRLQNLPNRLLRFQPYDPEKIPVVFVHGTFSSPVWWAEMINTLNGDPELKNRYQFWYFFYNSSNLITTSAADLRSEIIRNIKKLDPGHKSEAMNKMVIIGHSQGGLLTKLTSVDTGDRLLKTVIKGDIDSLDTSEETKKAIRENLIIKPIPSVKRLIFISTPHRGSFLSKSLARTIVRHIVRMPENIVQGTKDLYRFVTDDVRRQWEGQVPTSVDTMSPDDPLLNAIADLPLAPGVKGNSIIAVKGDEDPKYGNDGVVEYKSAHLGGMESELIVRSGHSCQDKPAAIEEVRRILLKHLDDK